MPYGRGGSSPLQGTQSNARYSALNPGVYALWGAPYCWRLPTLAVFESDTGVVIPDEAAEHMLGLTTGQKIGDRPQSSAASRRSGRLAAQSPIISEPG